MAPEPILTAYFINPSHQSVSVCVSLLSLLGNFSGNCILAFIATQRLGKQAPATENKCNNRRIGGRVYLWVCLCIPQSLLGNSSTKTFPRQRRIVEGVVFYVIQVVTEESSGSVLPRTYSSKCNEYV
jgi:hypothetical protein